MNLKDEFLKSIQPLPSDVYNYNSIELAKIEIMTDRAAMLRFRIKHTDRFGTHWVPLSHIRKDKKNSIWLSKWYCEKEGILKC